MSARHEPLIADRYAITVTRAKVGHTASVTWYPSEGAIGLAGPTFCRPTSRWAKRRADREVARRMRKHAREASALTTLSGAS